jgi:hypothetical protein
MRYVCEISHAEGKTVQGIRWEYRPTRLGAGIVGSLKQPPAKPVRSDQLPALIFQNRFEPHFGQKYLVCGMVG